MDAALTVTRPGAGRITGGVALLVLAAAVGRLATGRGPDSDLTVVAVGIAAVVASAGALLALHHGRNSDRYLVAAAVWGLGTAVAGSFPTTALGPFPLPHLAAAVGCTGTLFVVLQLLLRARSGTDDPPLLVDALMLATALAAAGWDAFARTGHTGRPGWAAGVVLVLAVTSLLSCASIALAIEQPRLRLAAVGMTLNGVGTALGVVCLPDQPALAHVALAVALVGGAVGLLHLPRDGVVQHGGEAAARAARRLETASLVPGPILLADLLLLVVSPRADPVLYGLFVSVLIAFTVRHAATARAIDRTTARLTFQALHDPLTGLANRTSLEAALTQPDHAQSLVLLELVGLDDVNDVLGVSAGDDVIRAAAAEVRDAAASFGGTAYRTSGDAIAVLLPGDAAQTLRHAETIIAAVSAAPAAVAGAGRFPLTAVAGIATCRVPAGTGSGVDPDRVDVMAPFVQADIALRDAKHLGGGAVSVYSGTVAAEHARRSLLRERLAAATREGGIDVHFQPVVSFTTGRVDKFEALARWEDPVLGRINPVEFIAVAEESNLVVALGEHVLRSAVRWAHEAGVFTAGVGLAVNVSVVQLQSPGFADIVRDVLDQHRIAPHLLTLELTESVFLDEDSPAERVVTELAALGCRIAIDDFGTGYSAFGYLGRLPVHVLKIDRSLTQSLTDDLNGQSVVTCVVDLATRLGLTVVVEGVETEEQADICRSISAPLGQGWLYSPAVPRALIGEQLARVYPVPGVLVEGGDRRV